MVRLTVDACIIQSSFSTKITAVNERELTKIHDMVPANGTVVYHDVCSTALGDHSSPYVKKVNSPHAHKATAFHYIQHKNKTVRRSKVGEWHKNKKARSPS